MRTRNKLLFIIIILLFSNLSSLFSEETWTIAVKEFSYAKGQKQSSITQATAQMFPSRILENISLSLNRSIPEDEALSRLRYKSKTERTSLFLQMSSAIQKRDSVFLENYTEKELKKKIAEQEKAIQDLRDKINENLKEIKEAEEKYEKSLVPSTESHNDFFDKFKNFFTSEEQNSTNEQITLYKNDVSALFQPSDTAKLAGIESLDFEKEVISAGIDGIISGTILSYGDFVSVTVDVHSFPGAKKIGSVTEIGNLTEADYIASSIARQLVPIITNSLPVQVSFSVEPENLRTKTSLYVDEQFFTELPSKLVLESGVHRIEFLADNYSRISTSYFFEGNHTYHVNAVMEEQVEGRINLNLKKPQAGELFANGIFQKNITVFTDEEDEIRSDSASISVNGKTILGEFIAKDGSSAFYYISEELQKKYSDYSLNVSTFNRSNHIEKRRRGMYRAYSVLVISLIPGMYVSGQEKAYSAIAEKTGASAEVKNKAVFYKSMKSAFTGISIGCGAWFAFELIRYFIAADTVLPVSAKPDIDFHFYENPVIDVQKDLAEIETEMDNPEIEPENNSEINSENENQKVDILEEGN